MKNKITALRFPEFEGEWEEKILLDFLIPTLRVIDKPRNKYLAIGIRSHCKGTFQKPDSDPEKIAMDKLFVVKENDLIVNITFAWEGAIALVKKEDDGGLVSHRFPTYIFNRSLVLQEYFKYVFVQKSFKFMLEMISPGGAGRNRVMSKTDFLKLKWKFPEIREQQKIADFLTAVDDKINQLTRKKTLLEQYKKGVMQKIFSQETRFPEFEGEWEEKKFGKIYSFHPTNSLSRDKLNYSKGKVKNIHYGDIHTKFSTIFIINEEDVPFIDEDINLNKISPDSYCQVGDLVVADASEDYIDIGKTIELKYLSDEKLLAGLHTFLARPQKNCMAIGFAGYLMQTWPVRKQLMTIAQGIKVLSLSKNRLAQISIILPTLPEQQKIADFLTGIDKKIELVNTQLEKTKEWKRGLLQQMFV